MTKQTRITLALASLMLVAMYIFPLWKITLEAPQYPEGLGLKIMLTDVQGQGKHDLRNINNLNHYIGMKTIEPDAIPELKIMPWIVAGLMAFGLLAALSGKPALLYAWCVVFFIVAIAGLIDFWLWAYDYGHNLDTEHAAIKVPGMTYQPPILGTKQLLNFKAHSWPALGGWAAFLSMGIGLVLSWKQLRARKGSVALPRTPLATAATMALIMVATGCQTGPQDIVYGEDKDDYCRMTISDARFATQIVTVTGKAYKFDSVECMQGFLASNRVEDADISGIWVTNAAEPGTLLPAESAVFVHSSSIRSPMGGGLIAYALEADAVAHAQEADGSIRSWSDLDQATTSHMH